jgi:hypothetical protein
MIVNSQRAEEGRSFPWRFNLKSYPDGYLRPIHPRASDIVSSLRASDYSIHCHSGKEFSPGIFGKVESVISEVWAGARCLGGYSKVLSVAALPVEAIPDDGTPPFKVPAYRVDVERDGKTETLIVDHQNLTHKSAEEWAKTVGLPAGKMIYPKNLGVGAGPGDTVELVTSDTPERDPDARARYVVQYIGQYQFEEWLKKHPGEMGGAGP